MRPIRLELEGFTAFREPTAIDFEGADLFVLCGPTGSGKSSVIDAMTFALYGSVPRYQDPKLVHPVISQGRQEAKVRFDFSIRGRPYSAVRVVRRVKRPAGWGAVTREARLESGDEVLAGSVGELDEKILALFGLSFEQFTTCVVLPQGEFARFLHEKPASRQDLLKELLRIHLYDRMAQLARARESGAKQRLAVIEVQLAELSGATPEARRGARKRVKALIQLRKKLEMELRALDVLEQQRKERERAGTDKEKLATVLAAVKIPPAVRAIATEQRHAEEDVARKTEKREEAEKALETAEAVHRALPDAEPLLLLVKHYAERTEQRRSLEDARAAAVRAAQHRKDAESTGAAAKAHLDGARNQLDALHRAHTAHDLAAGLSAGEPCPVCLRPLDAAPSHPEPPALAEIQERVEAAKRTLARAEAEQREAVEGAGRAAGAVSQIEKALVLLDGRLAGAQEPERLNQQLQEIAGAVKHVNEARKAAEHARAAERKAARERETVASKLRAAWEDHDRMRDAVATLEPPAPNREDLETSWEKLARWAEEQSKRFREAAGLLAAEVGELAIEIDAKRAALRNACAAEEVEPQEGEEIRDAVVHALARAEAEVEQIDASIARHAELSGRQREVKEEKAVAHSLAQHLGPHAFERWLLQEAFQRLVVEGGHKLRELSCGSYSFAASERLDFEIIDHRNADEVRSARTLSGGETFLASLALALTLAEQVAELAAEGAAPLESMFLDEGFGTLDPDTLDTVASTIEELGARGRCVGLVTHIRELADRIAVQYRVNRDPATASVERIVS